MRAKVQRSSIVDSRGIGRSTPTAWCFVQAGLPVQGGPDQQRRVWPVPNRHIARTSSLARPTTDIAVPHAKLSSIDAARCASTTLAHRIWGLAQQWAGCFSA
jgi:hypothetical protein